MILNKSFNAMIFKYIYFIFFYVKPEQEHLDNHNPNKTTRDRRTVWYNPVACTAQAHLQYS